jgi:hypothetical protein
MFCRCVFSGPGGNNAAQIKEKYCTEPQGKILKVKNTALNPKD